LFLAAREGHVGVVQTLCVLGVDVTAVAADGTTPRTVAGKWLGDDAQATIFAALPEAVE
jgi:hypothetical protein